MNQVAAFASSGARPTTRTLLVVSFPESGTAFRNRGEVTVGSSCLNTAQKENRG
jgi:hypothetical protein